MALEFPVSDAHDPLADVLNAIADGGEVAYVTREGQRVAAIVPLSMVAAFEAAEDAEDLADAQEALARIKAGDAPIPLEQLRDEWKV